MAESADATDLKSVGRNTVRVRPPLAPQSTCAFLRWHRFYFPKRNRPLQQVIDLRPYATTI